MAGLVEIKGVVKEKDYRDIMKADKSGSYRAGYIKYVSNKGEKELKIPEGYLKKAAALKKGFDSVSVGDNLVLTMDTSKSPWAVKEIAVDAVSSKESFLAGSGKSSSTSSDYMKPRSPEEAGQIIRQNSLTNAVATLTAAGKVPKTEDVIALAKIYETYSKGEYDTIKAAHDLGIAMDDFEG